MFGDCLEDDYGTPWTNPAPSHLVNTAERQRLNRQLDAIFDEVDPSWRDRKRAALAEAEMLWHNQGITYLSQDWREMLASLGAAFRDLINAEATGEQSKLQAAG